jgi:hypothetical protein
MVNEKAQNITIGHCRIQHYMVADPVLFTTPTANPVTIPNVMLTASIQLIVVGLYAQQVTRILPVVRKVFRVSIITLQLNRNMTVQNVPQIKPDHVQVCCQRTTVIVLDMFLMVVVYVVGPVVQRANAVINVVCVVAIVLDVNCD